MKPTAENLEAVLRNAPVPPPPANLKRHLREQAPVPAARAESRLWPSGGAWFRNWWPSLASASVALACLAVLAVQQSQIQELRAAIGRLSQPAASTPAPSLRALPLPARPPEPASPGLDDRLELERLRGLVQAAAADIAILEAIQAQNAQMQRDLAAATGPTAEETEALRNASDKARSIQCINNLKQLGLSARVWATDNDDVLPPNVLSMTNEMATPKILICPADTARQPAASWGEFSNANLSYEFLAPSAPETEPQRVAFRCPAHGHVALCDGSVQSSVAKEHPGWLVQRDGKLYCEPSAR